MRFLPIILLLCTACTAQKGQQSSEFEPVAMDTSIWVVFQASDGKHWFGSNGQGVYRWDGTNLEHFTTEDGLLDNQIRGIQEDALGRLFIESPRGVNMLDGEGFTALQPIVSSDNEWELQPTDLWFNCNGELFDIYRFDGSNLYQLALPRVNLDSAFDLGASRFSSYAVYGIDKDRDGNLWIGTLEAGAFRYDGEKFLWIAERELSRLEDGRVPAVRALLQDKEGYMWLSNFLSRYKIDEDGSYEILPGLASTDPQLEDIFPYFNSGMVDDQGNVWMTSFRGNVWKYDGDSLTAFQVDVEGIEYVSLYQDREGVIWLGTNNDGVYRMEDARFVPAF